jgi:hypothetical protein
MQPSGGIFCRTGNPVRIGGWLAIRAPAWPQIVSCKTRAGPLEPVCTESFTCAERATQPSRR